MILSIISIAIGLALFGLIIRAIITSPYNDGEQR